MTALTLNVPWFCPATDPLKGIDKLGFEAFEAIAIFPLKLPEDCGAKVTLKDVLCPGVKVTGAVIPEILKPVPVADACEIMRFTPPEFFKVSVWD